jgi:hypothetical protein
VLPLFFPVFMYIKPTAKERYAFAAVFHSPPERYNS